MGILYLTVDGCDCTPGASLGERFGGMGVFEQIASEHRDNSTMCEPGETGWIGLGDGGIMYIVSQLAM